MRVRIDKIISAQRCKSICSASLCRASVRLQVKQRQEEEKKHLVALRDQLRPVVHTEQVSGTKTPARSSFPHLLCISRWLVIVLLLCRTLYPSRFTPCISWWATSSTGRRDQGSSTRRVTGKNCFGSPWCICDIVLRITLKSPSAISFNMISMRIPKGNIWNYVNI